jgi:CheY-like chemotaxis protein
MAYGEVLMDCIDSGHSHILLAEDNPVNQKITQKILKRLGYPVDVAANGLEVLEALERQSYDIILMDIQMPMMDGLEATRIIRQRLSLRKQPKIIAVTAHALDYSREMCIDAGMDEYIAKPVQKNDLAEVLSRYQPSNFP